MTFAVDGRLKPIIYLSLYLSCFHNEMQYKYSFLDGDWKWERCGKTVGKKFVKLHTWNCQNEINSNIPQQPVFVSGFIS